MIDLTSDFRDILIELSDAQVEFLVVGAFAVAFHGHARATKDIDIFVRANSVNATKLYRALAEFGAPLSQFEVTENDFAKSDNILQIGMPPRRIDIINSLTGIDFEEATANQGEFDLEGRNIKVIGEEALIKNKKAAGRAQDLADVEALTNPKRKRI